MTWPITVNYFLFILNPLTKEELKAYEILESYSQFASGWVKEVKIKVFLNYLLKLPWLLDGLLSRSARRASRHPAFMGNCPTINHKC